MVHSSRHAVFCRAVCGRRRWSIPSIASIITNRAVQRWARAGRDRWLQWSARRRGGKRRRAVGEGRAATVDHAPRHAADRHADGGVAVEPRPPAIDRDKPVIVEGHNAPLDAHQAIVEVRHVTDAVRDQAVGVHRAAADAETAAPPIAAPPVAERAMAGILSVGITRSCNDQAEGGDDQHGEPVHGRNSTRG